MMNDERYVRKGYKIWDTYLDREVQELNYRSQSDYMCEVLNEKESRINILVKENEKLKKENNDYEKQFRIINEKLDEYIKTADTYRIPISSLKYGDDLGYFNGVYQYMKKLKKDIEGLDRSEKRFIVTKEEIIEKLRNCDKFDFRIIHYKFDDDKEKYGDSFEALSKNNCFVQVNGLKFKTTRISEECGRILFYYKGLQITADEVYDFKILS